MKSIVKAKFGLEYVLNRSRYLLREKSISNIYHAGVQKTGSQWIKTIFNDKEIQKKTRLITYPQQRYEWDEFQKKFPEFSFIPGLYISYQSYEEIEKPEKYKTLYITRDPRNILTSWYYSMKYSHEPFGKVLKHRENLSKLDVSDGVTYCIKHFQLKFSFMKDWHLNCDDPNVIFLKFEDLIEDPVSGLKYFFDQCGINFSTKELTRICENYSKEKMRKRDKEKKSEGKISHYRKNPKNWQDLFNDSHKELFKDLNGNLIELLGYKEF